MSSRFTAHTVLPVLVPIGLLLAGCSGGEPAAGPSVASVATTTARVSGSPSPTADPESKRPQFRVDTTEAEKARLISAWGACLKRKGVPTYEKGDGEARFILTEADPKEYPKQFRACADKEPVYPAALDPARNPDYNDDMRAWVKCINRESPTIKVIGTDDGPRVKDGSRYDNASAAERQRYEQVERSCQYEAFGRD